MAHWIRFAANGRVGFGTLEEGVVSVYDGDIFGRPIPTATCLAIGDITLLAPCVPSKMIGLWNNFHALREKIGAAVPEEPLYFIKAGTSLAHPGATIPRPPSYPGKVIYEGELGIVIGRTCSHVSEAEAPDVIFGYTCVNDITALEILNRDPSFPQWARAKGFDGFGPFGPAIATGLDPANLSIRAVLNGQERQNYPVADMICPPARIVSRISHDMTLLPGDLILCGTSVGAGVMKEPRNVIEISIDGIGTLMNIFES